MRWHQALHNSAEAASPCSAIVAENESRMPRARQNSCASWPLADPSYAKYGTPEEQETRDLRCVISLGSIGLWSGRVGRAEKRKA